MLSFGGLLSPFRHAHQAHVKRDFSMRQSKTKASLGRVYVTQSASVHVANQRALLATTTLLCAALRSARQVKLPWARVSGPRNRIGRATGWRLKVGRFLV